jgi:hypothetical protein
VTNQIVTGLYAEPSGALYYGVAREAEGIGFPDENDHAVWTL